MTIHLGQLGLPKPIVDTLARKGVTEPFPIQAATIPDALAGRDVCGKAPTGSGKTLAFGIPLLARIAPARPSRPRGLVLVPTRELADQIARELQPLAKATSRRMLAIYGGVGYGGQKSALRRGADVVVATPGRLEDLIAQGSVDLSEVDIVVLDEADRMADMGFLPAVRRILDRTPSGRQTLLFSATLDHEIAVLSRDYQQRPVRHEVGATETRGEPATHHFWLVEQQDRTAHAGDLIAAEGKSIVFTRTRRGADRLTKQLGRLGVKADALHGGRSQAQRTRALDAFSSGRTAALVATDVAARGIHVEGIAAVIHFDPAADAKDYLHRSGRTGRAGAGGRVVTLLTHSQRREVQAMARKLDLDVRLEAPPNASSRPEGEDGDSGSGGQGDESIYVANLPWTVTPEGLRTLFGPFGQVQKSTVIMDRKTGRSRGFGFVDMAAGAAGAAIQQLNGSLLEGRELTVRRARPSTGR